MSCRSKIFVEELGFVHQVLSFAMRKFPPGLLDNLKKILRQVSSIPDSVIVRRVRVQTIVPRASRKPS
jgi:hypothetical protein